MHANLLELVSLATTLVSVSGSFFMLKSKLAVLEAELRHNEKKVDAYRVELLDKLTTEKLAAEKNCDLRHNLK